MVPASFTGQSLVEQFREIFDGQPWYGESLILKLNKIRDEANQPEDLSKTASFIQHLINWRQFAIQKLQGNAEFDIVLNTDADWTDITIAQFEDWELLLLKLDNTQNQLLELLGGKTDESLKETVPGKAYSFIQMLHGLLQHDVYHTGQIAVYWKHK